MEDSSLTAIRAGAGSGLAVEMKLHFSNPLE
jgi:hypothetical protein